MMRAILRGLTALLATSLVAVLVMALVNWPAKLDTTITRTLQADDLDEFLVAAEAQIDSGPGIVPGTNKRIRWIDPATRQPTPLAVVYLHGFSATRQETAPYAENLANALGANLFETRLKGHGLRSAKLEDVTAEDWLADATEALNIGEQIGERVVIVGTSTGATLALLLRQLDTLDNVAAMILMSPNFGLQDSSSDLLTGPGGPLLARILAGDTHSWPAANEEQELYWSTRYPMSAIIEMMRLVDALRESPRLPFNSPILAILSPRDDVIDYQAALNGLGQLDAPAVEIVNVDTVGAGHHVLAGNILAPQNTAPLIERTLGFLQEHKLIGHPAH